MPIPIYPAEERVAGLAEKIAKASAVSCGVNVAPNLTPNLTKAKAGTVRAVAANLKQLDLYYLKSILASTGWNKNDDYFDPSQTWLARTTAEDKPFDLEHKQDDIIGHITDCYAVGEDNEKITADEAPAFFRVASEAVIYKAFEDEVLQKRIDDIIAEIEDDKWYVSMEALFDDFDYVTMEGETSKVISRNKDTAFLTKYLKAYGGDGTFQNKRLGRVLKNITFSGKGLVKKPANPESVIIEHAAGAAVYTESSDIPKESTVAKEVTKADDGGDDAMAALAAQVKAATDKNDAYEAKMKEYDDAAIKAKAEYDAMDANYKSLAEKYTKAEMALKKGARSSKIKSALADMDESEANDMCEATMGLDDESFDKYMDCQAKFVKKLTDAASKVKAAEIAVPAVTPKAEQVTASQILAVAVPTATDGVVVSTKEIFINPDIRAKAKADLQDSGLFKTNKKASASKETK